MKKVNAQRKCLPCEGTWSSPIEILTGENRGGDFFGSRSHIILYQTILIRRNLFRRAIQQSRSRIHECHGQSNALGILVFINILCFASQFFLYKIRIASAVFGISIMIIFFFFVAARSTPLALTLASRVEILVFF